MSRDGFQLSGHLDDPPLPLHSAPLHDAVAEQVAKRLQVERRWIEVISIETVFGSDVAVRIEVTCPIVDLPEPT